MNTYPDRYAVDDRGAAWLLIRVHRGDDYATKLGFKSRHAQEDGTFLRLPMDMSNVVFDSEITDGSGKMVAEFQILDLDDMGIVSILLPGADTAMLPVGTYKFWIQGNNFDTGYSTEKVQGNVEILPK